MRLLLISPHYHTFVKDQVEAISKYVNKVNVLIHHNNLAELARCLPFSYFKHVEKFAKHNIVDMKRKPENVDIHVISTIYFIPDSKNFGLGDKLFNIFKKYIKRNKIEFDLIHAHFTWPCGYAAVKLGKEFKVPVIVTAHGYDIYDLPFRGSNWLRNIKLTLNSSDCVITVSKSNFRIITKKLDTSKNKVCLIPNGFNSRLFKPIDKLRVRKQLGIREDKVILNVANLILIKGHRHLIESMKKIAKIKEDVILYIIGEGPLKSELKKQIKKFDLGKKVRFVGAKPHDEIPLWMNAADIFVLSSLSEGNPTVMFEALGVGLPFVGTTVGGVPEIITSEDYGLLCKPANPDDLAEKILIALDKEWDREKIRKYAEQFSWDNIARKVVSVYLSLV